MSQEVADRVKHLPRIAINTTYKLAPDAEMIYAADAAWWKLNPEALNCPGVKVSIAHDCDHPKEVLLLRKTGREGFDPNPECLRTGGNSGYQAIQVAMHAQAKRILLLGFDMHGSHWHGDHAAPLRNNSSPIYESWISMFQTLAPHPKALGIEVLNCTPGSRLTCFPMVDLEEALEGATVDR